MKKNNISYVVKNKLCLGCGICYSICNQNAITFSEAIDKRPVINDNCNNCQKCINNCPGLYPKSKKQSLLGCLLKCFSGYANDEKIRKSASSGGIITGLNLFLLKEKIYEGVVCIRQSKKDIYQNEVILATSKADLLSAKGSRYSPTFIGSAFKDLPLKKNKKYIFVGKPCDIQALNNFLKLNKGFKFLKIAIFCAYTPDMSATKEIFNYYNIDDQQVTRFQYRGNGWPGFFRAYSKNKIILNKDYREIWDNLLCKLTNIRKRCFLCHDCTGEQADISVGDAWLKEYSEQKSNGHSVIIVRSELGLKTIEKSIAKGILKLNEVNKKIVINSQKNLLRKKKHLFLKRMIGKLLFEKIPIEKIPLKFSFNGLCKIPGFFKYYIINKSKLKK